MQYITTWLKVFTLLVLSSLFSTTQAGDSEYSVPGFVLGNEQKTYDVLHDIRMTHLFIDFTKGLR